MFFCAAKIRTISLSQKTKENLFALAWREIALLRTFVQGESRSQVYLDYAEPQPIFVQASAIELAHIAEHSQNLKEKCQEKVHLYEQNRTFTAQKQQGESI